MCYHSTSHETSKEMFLCHQKAQEGFSVLDEGKTPVFQNVVLQLSRPLEPKKLVIIISNCSSCFKWMGTYWQNAFPYFHCLCVCGGLLVINMVISSTGSGYKHRSPTPLLWDPLFVWASQSEEGEDSHIFPGKQTTNTLGGSSFYRQCLFLREYYCIMCIFILFSSVFKMLLLLRSLWVCSNKGSNGSCWEMMTQTLCRSKRYSFENNSTWLTLTCSNIIL